MGSISHRLTLGFATLVTITTAAVLSLGGWLLWRQMVQGLDFLNEAEFSELRERLQSAPQPPDAAEISRRIRDHTEIDAAMYYFQVLLADGTILFRSLNLGESALPVSPEETLPSWTAHTPALGSIRISEFEAGPLHVQVASPLSPTQRLLRTYTRVSAWLLAATSVVSLGLGYGFTRFALKPIRLIRETAVRIRGDRLDERIPVSSARDEISALATLLNQMFDRLEASFLQVKRFTADASHELKTPLTLIRLNAEKLRPAVAADATASAALEDLFLDISRVNQIIESLLFIAKAESGTFTLPRTEENTTGFLQTVAEDAAALAEDRGLAFSLNPGPSATVSINSGLLHQLLLNLVNNALNVSPAGSKLSLDSTLSPTAWTLTLLDEGPGLPPSQLDRVFERFVRFESSPSDTAQPAGHGLGLAICRSIAQLHGGEIRAENRTDRSGLRVVVTLPRQPAA